LMSLILIGFSRTEIWFAPYEFPAFISLPPFPKAWGLHPRRPSPARAGHRYYEGSSDPGRIALPCQASGLVSPCLPDILPPIAPNGS
jgi:hypothetical protein